MNWRRGGHRIFLVLCAVWAVAVLLAFPLVETTRSQKAALEVHALRGSGGYSAETQKSLERLEAVHQRQSSLSWFYREEMLKNLGLVLAALIVPPLGVYVLARAVFAIIDWLVNGFRSPPPT
jgi:hypothetical protein